LRTRVSKRTMGSALAGGEEGEAGLGDIVVGDVFHEHRAGADPEGAVAVELTVDNELFLGLGVAGDAEDEVLVPFIVSVAAGKRCGGSGGHAGGLGGDGEL